MNKQIKRIILLVFIFTAAIGFNSCFVDYGLDTNNYDLVVTNYNPEYNFSAVTKYSLIDSVVHMGEDEISHAYDQQILDKVKAKVDALGWEQVYDSTANIIIAIGTTSSTTVVYGGSGWYDYYGWYGGWGYYPYYGAGSSWYYPYYPYYSYSYEYSTASLVVRFVDPRLGSETEVPVQWIAVMNGLINSSNPSTRINTAIDQAFSQSPYLK